MQACSCTRQAGVKPTRPQAELAHVFRRHGDVYRRAHRLPAAQLQAMRRIERCRTVALGGHLDRCDHCGFERNAYNSCANRHCPKCQTFAKETWLRDREAEILPVSYFHAVFTLPHELNPLVLDNPTVLFNMLFATVSELLQDFAANPRWKLSGQLGFIAVLHTWSQVLLDHFHLHCIIPAGAISTDRSAWHPCPNPDFLFNVEALGIAFRGKFLAALKLAYKQGALHFHRDQALRSPRHFYRLIAKLYRKHWNVYCKKPLAGPRQVLDYLARYTHRIAISNHRIRSVTSHAVTFTYKDRRDHGRTKRLQLQPHEFIRRFLLHILPPRFRRVRHFGFLANRAKQRALPLIRSACGQPAQPPEPAAESPREFMQRVLGLDISLCPHCRQGTMFNTGLPPKAMPDHEP